MRLAKCVVSPKQCIGPAVVWIEPQTQKPPCSNRFVGDSQAQADINAKGNNAWDTNTRDHSVPVVPGTQSEADRNAEHYEYSFMMVSQNSYQWGPMLVRSVLYNTAKFWDNLGGQAGLYTSRWKYTPVTTDELAAGFAGANDALFGRPSSCVNQ